MTWPGYHPLRHVGLSSGLLTHLGPTSHSVGQIVVKVESKSGWVPVIGKTYLLHIL